MWYVEVLQPWTQGWNQHCCWHSREMGRTRELNLFLSKRINQPWCQPTSSNVISQMSLLFEPQVAAKSILIDITAKASWLLHLSTEQLSTGFLWLQIWYPSAISGSRLSRSLLVLLCRWVSGKCGLWFWETTWDGPKYLLAASFLLIGCFHRWILKCYIN